MVVMSTQLVQDIEKVYLHIKIFFIPVCDRLATVSKVKPSSTFPTLVCRWQYLCQSPTKCFHMLTHHIPVPTVVVCIQICLLYSQYRLYSSQNIRAFYVIYFCSGNSRGVYILSSGAWWVKNMAPARSAAGLGHSRRPFWPYENETVFYSGNFWFIQITRESIFFEFIKVFHDCWDFDNLVSLYIAKIWSTIILIISLISFSTTGHHIPEKL